MFLITASFGFLQPFVPLFWEASGLSRAHIGLVSGLGTGAALLIQPLLGRLSDKLDARRPLMAAAAITAGLAYYSFQWADGPFAFGVLTAVGVNGTIYLNAAAGAICGRIAGPNTGGATYAAYRVWGSVGYIVVALLTGYLINGALTGGGGMTRKALAPVFRWGPSIFAAIALLTLWIPDPRSRMAPAKLPAETDLSASDERDRGLLQPFLISFFLYQFALYGASAYLSLFMKALGATPLWITGTFAAGVVCEVLVMTRIGRISDAYGRKPVLAVAFLLMPLRLLCYIPATGPTWVMVVQLLHGLNFGIMGAVAIAYVNDIATDRNRGALQASLASVGGLAVAIGPAVCGAIAQRFGLGWMFASMAVVGAAGALVFMLRVQEPRGTIHNHRR
jgi:MFS family permease